MAKQTKAVKKHRKAQNIKGEAVGSFSLAVLKVEEANELLIKSKELDEQTMADIEGNISALYVQLDEVQADRLKKDAEIAANVQLIEKLKQFTI